MLLVLFVVVIVVAVVLVSFMFFDVLIVVVAETPLESTRSTNPHLVLGLSENNFAQHACLWSASCANTAADHSLLIRKCGST